MLAAVTLIMVFVHYAGKLDFLEEADDFDIDAHFYIFSDLTSIIRVRNVCKYHLY